jgi:hypothetical protein
MQFFELALVCYKTDIKCIFELAKQIVTDY